MTGSGPVALGPRGSGALEGLLARRRSVKAYRPDALGVDELGRLLWAAAGELTGIESPQDACEPVAQTREPVGLAAGERLPDRHAAASGRRTHGSAHARYDVTVTVAAAGVTGLAPAAYRYLPRAHALEPVREGNHLPALAAATLDADWLERCPAALVLSADPDAADAAFAGQGPGRGERFCWVEAGMIAQNVHLWAAENSLGTVFLGGLDSAVTAHNTHGLVPVGHTVLAMLPIGHPTRDGST